MTKKQRLERYKDAYHYIDNGMHKFMCHALTTGIGTQYGYWFEENMPEFALFNPTHKRVSESGAWTYVLNNDTQSHRLTILAFCIAMCEE